MRFVLAQVQIREVSELLDIWTRSRPTQALERDIEASALRPGRRTMSGRW